MDMTDKIKRHNILDLAKFSASSLCVFSAATYWKCVELKRWLKKNNYHYLTGQGRYKNEMEPFVLIVSIEAMEAILNSGAAKWLLEQDTCRRLTEAHPVLGTRDAYMCNLHNGSTWNVENMQRIGTWREDEPTKDNPDYTEIGSITFIVTQDEPNLSPAIKAERETAQLLYDLVLQIPVHPGSLYMHHRVAAYFKEQPRFGIEGNRLEYGGP